MSNSVIIPTSTTTCLFKGHPTENLNSFSNNNICSDTDYTAGEDLELFQSALDRPRRGSLRIFTFKLDAFTLLREAMKWHRFTFKLEFKMYVYKESRSSKFNHIAIKYN